MASFLVKVYNHSPATMDFEVTNDRCMYLPAKKRITVPAFSWGMFDMMETCNKLWKGCLFSKSRFTISGYRGSKMLGNTTYRVAVSVLRQFFGVFTEKSMSFDRGSNAKRSDALVFDRHESYGDLFFNGRGLYFNDNLRGKLSAYSMGKNYDHIDDMPPTSLVNSNRQFVHEVDDSSLRNIAANWLNVGLAAADGYSFFSGMKRKTELVDPKDLLDPEKLKAKDDSRLLDAAWKQIKDIGTSYYSVYKDVIANADEMTVNVHAEYFPIQGDDPVSSSFHLVFTDTTANAPDIMLGNFYLPPPPDNDSTFYQNILHLSKEPEKLKQAV